MLRSIVTYRYLVLTAVIGSSIACNSSGPAPVQNGSDDAQVESGQRTLTVAPESGAPGTGARLTGTGYEPNSTVAIGVGPVQSEYSIIGQTRADAQGRIDTTVTVPAWMVPGLRIVFVAAAEDASWKVISNEFEITGMPQDSRMEDEVTVTGMLTSEGVECQAMRGDDGQLYTLVGDLVGFSAGTRVRITGTPVEVSFCMQGTTIDVKTIERI